MKESEKVVRENQRLAELNNTITKELNKLMREHRHMREEMSHLRVSGGTSNRKLDLSVEKLWRECPEVAQVPWKTLADRAKSRYIEETAQAQEAKEIINRYM